MYLSKQAFVETELRKNRQGSKGELIEFFDDFERIVLAFSSKFCTLFFLSFCFSQCVASHCGGCSCRAQPLSVWDQ